MHDIAQNLLQVQKEIARAALRAGRKAEDVQLVAVSKTFPAACVEEAARAGQQHFGENRIQEAESKIPAVTAGGLRWHLIGHLQSNKAKKAVELFDVIETLDSPRIAEKVGHYADQLEKDLEVFIQVNVGGEEQKYGIVPGELATMVSLIDAMPRLRLIGLMTIPPFHPDPELERPYYRQMKNLLQDVNASRALPVRGLSMGMSHDFPVAIEEGATEVRVGTALFGSRV